MNKYAFKLLIVISLSGVSCKDKKHCEGSNSVSGVVKNGTTMQGIKNVQLSFALVTLNSAGQTESTVDVGTVMTNDTGGFHFEYPCQDRDFDRIVIDALPPYGGYVHASEGYTKQLGNRIYYFADDGNAQIVLQPKTALGSDTLFVTYGVNDGSGGISWTYRDSFNTSTVPTFWKKVRGHKGGGRFIFWGRGINDLTNAINANNKNRIIVSITGDPVVDSVYVKY